jgi:hypothetical protein
MASYRLNLNQQANGDYEVHKDDCRYYPEQNYDYLGVFSSCGPAVAEAKRKHTSLNRINGCYWCSELCHTT